MKNIIVCGVLDNIKSSNIWMARALKRMGFNVIPINYRTILAKYGAKTFESLFLNTIDTYNPVLTILCKCNGVSTSTIKKISDKCLTWLFFMDSYRIAEMSPDIVENAKSCRFSSCTSEITVDYFKDNGVENCYHIFEGIDTSIHRPMIPEEKYKAFISFAGAKTAERQELRDIISSASYDTKFYGTGWENEGIYNEEWAKMCSSSTLVLSINSFSDIPTYFSGRVFESLGCGSCTLHYDPTETLRKYFEDGKEIVFFKSKSDLVEKIKSLTEEDIKNISIYGRERILQNYTWIHSLSRMFNIINR